MPFNIEIEALYCHLAAKCSTDNGKSPAKLMKSGAWGNSNDGPGGTNPASGFYMRRRRLG